MSDHDRIRQDQTNYGRSTLGVKPGYHGTGKPSGGGNGGPKPRKAYTPKGHDAILAELQESRSPTSFMMTSGEQLDGVVVARDKFTITLDKDGRRLTLYKHAIEFFSASAKSMTA